MQAFAALHAPDESPVTLATRSGFRSQQQYVVAPALKNEVTIGGQRVGEGQEGEEGGGGGGRGAGGRDVRRRVGRAVKYRRNASTIIQHRFVHPFLFGAMRVRRSLLIQLSYTILPPRRIHSSLPYRSIPPWVSIQTKIINTSYVLHTKRNNHIIPPLEATTYITRYTIHQHTIQGPTMPCHAAPPYPRPDHPATGLPTIIRGQRC